MLASLKRGAILCNIGHFDKRPTRAEMRTAGDAADAPHEPPWC